MKDLTTREEQIVKLALLMGYFEFPKKIRLEELSERLGISEGTLSEILMRAEKTYSPVIFASTKNLVKQHNSHHML